MENQNHNIHINDIYLLLHYVILLRVLSLIKSLPHLHDRLLSQRKCWQPHSHTFKW